MQTVVYDSLADAQERFAAYSAEQLRLTQLLRNPACPRRAQREQRLHDLELRLIPQTVRLIHQLLAGTFPDISG